MHNLGIVYKFEVIRTLKKKTFWISILAFPLMFALIFAVIFFANKATSDKTAEMSKERFSIAYTDQAQIVNPGFVQAMSLQPITDKQAGIDRVKSGAVDAYFYYPADLRSSKVEVYAKDAGLFQNGKYSSVAQMLMTQSAEQTVSGNLQAVLSNHVTINTQTYQDGEPYDGMAKVIVPGLFLVLFYFTIVMFGNQAMVSTTEEKENRVIEMILTTVESRTLVIGKILSIITLAMIQVALLVIPAIIAYINLHSQLSLPMVDLSSLEFDTARIVVAVILFAVSFMMFTGLLVTVGAATPTAKEAGGFFGAFMMLLFGPLYAAPLFVSAPEALLVKILTFFPLTSPIPLLLRNAVGNLEVWEIVTSLVILTVFTILTLMVAVRVFRYGSVEYSKKLSLKTVLSRRRTGTSKSRS